jgi:hypothetical protein
VLEPAILPVYTALKQAREDYEARGLALARLSLSVRSATSGAV